MEQSNTSMNVNLQDNKESSNKLKVTILKGTPFNIVEENEEFFAILGNHKITDNYKTFKECEKETVKITWDRLIQVIWAVAEKVETIKQLKNQINE